MDYSQAPVHSVSNSSEFQFLGRWTFDSHLATRLKKFTTSATYKFTIKSNNSFNECTKFIHEKDTEDPEANEIIDDVNQDREPCGVDNGLNETISQPVLLSTQDCSKVIFNLREGPISDDELSSIREEDISSLVNCNSNDVIFNFCESVCSTVQFQDKFVPLLCENVLLPKIKDPMFTTCSRTFLPTIKRTFEVFPAEACCYLLVPLLGDHDLHCKLDLLLIGLDNGTKQIILKSLLEEGIEILEEHHIPLIQSLLVSLSDKDTIQKLIDLVSLSGNNLSKSSSFGKLLLCIIEQIGQFLESDVKKKLFNTIQTHKSIQRVLIMKAFQSITSGTLPS